MHTLYKVARSRPSLAALAVAMATAVALGGNRPAIGEDQADPEARLQAFTVQLKEQEVADTRHAATSEIGKAEALRDQARTLTEKRKDRDALVRTLDELEATLALVSAKIVHAQAKAELDEQQAKMDAVKTTLAQTKKEADALEQQQAALESKLGGGK